MRGWSDGPPAGDRWMDRKKDTIVESVQHCFVVNMYLGACPEENNVSGRVYSLL